MKSLKKTLVLLVVFSMILSAVMPAFAATDVYGLDCEEEVARLEALEVVSGYEDGTYKPENTVTRAEMAVILCKMVGQNEVVTEENKNVPSKFTDVAVGEWYTGYINVAAGKGLLSGFPDGTFRPNEQLTMNQVLTLCVNALGRGEHVAQMGTWPANYIAEATKLGLLDGVKTSDANRGNVALIVWNTLEAPAVWDVTGTEYSDGSINLSNSHASLLSIYFRDYVNENGELKEIEEVAVAAGDLTVDNHILVAKTELDVFDYDKVDGINTFDFNKNTVKNKKEKTYLNEAGTGVYVYVPADVCEDLDELKGKNVTIILGEDNVAVAIFVEDKVETKDFLTAYDQTKKEIVVGGTRYDLAADLDKNTDGTDDAFGYTVVLNGKAYNGSYPSTIPVEAALAVFDIDTKAEFENIEKKIEAEITLNDEDEVATIELFASYYIDDFSDEALITKVKETSTTYTIQTTEKNISWDLEAEEDEEIEFPKVYIDGEKATMRDLEAGMVITVVGGDLDANIVLDNTKSALKIYATTEGVVEGDVTRVKNSNKAITLDGTVYTATKAGVQPSIEELAKYNSGADTLDPDKVVKSELVTLYLNIHGEYAYVILDDVASDYTFGVVTFVSSNITWEGEDEEIAVRNIKLLLEDGTRKTFKLKADSEDDKYNAAWVETGAPYTKLQVGNFVAVEADADRVIEIEDGTEINIIGTNAVVKDLNNATVAKIGDYVIVNGLTAPDKDDEEFKDGLGNIYEYNSNDTTIFNAATTELEVVTKWKAILSGATFKDANTLAIFEDDTEDVAKYMLVTISGYGNEDATYAIVNNSAYLEDDGKQYVDFVGAENVELAAEAVTPLTNINGWLVEYVMSSDKVASAFKLIDAANFLTAKDVDDLDIYVPERTIPEADVTLVKEGTVTATFDSKATFLTKVGNVAGEYVFTYNGTKWNLSGAATAADLTDLTAYGITATAAVDTDTVTVTVVGSDTMVAWGETIVPERVEQIELAEVKVSNSGKITLVYVETDHDLNPANDDEAIDSIKLDKDLIKVYDLRNGKVEVKDIKDIQAEVASGDPVFAIPARNADYEGDGENLLFIVK